jgi:hypothetical protein
MTDSNMIVPPPSCVQFQLSLIFAENINKQHLVPHSLNYLGLLSPTNSNSVFKPVLYFCSECLFEHDTHFKSIDFYLPQSDNLFTVSAHLTHTGHLDLSLE